MPVSCGYVYCKVRTVRVRITSATCRLAMNSYCTPWNALTLPFRGRQGRELFIVSTQLKRISLFQNGPKRAVRASPTKSTTILIILAARIEQSKVRPYKKGTHVQDFSDFIKAKACQVNQQNNHFIIAMCGVD